MAAARGTNPSGSKYAIFEASGSKKRTLKQKSFHSCMTTYNGINSNLCTKNKLCKPRVRIALPVPRYNLIQELFLTLLMALLLESSGLKGKMSGASGPLNGTTSGASGPLNGTSNNWETCLNSMPALSQDFKPELESGLKPYRGAIPQETWGALPGGSKYPTMTHNYAPDQNCGS